jgi:uncharacterized protein (DUF305 family)
MTTTRVRDDADVDAVEDLDDVDEPRPTRRLSVRWWVALLAVVLVAAVTAFVAVLVVRPSYPGDDSPEAGFARDMQQHHAQAVEMSIIVRDRTDDAPTRLLAYDILTTQENQEGQMLGWLQNWGDSQARTAPAMAWMGHEGMTGATMPGMATPEQLAKLKTLSGRDAEVFFLQLMIAHHRGGVEMAQAILGLTQQPEVVELANSMMTSQQADIALMESMLAERGATDQIPAN